MELDSTVLTVASKLLASQKSRGAWPKGGAGPDVALLKVKVFKPYLILYVPQV